MKLTLMSIIFGAFARNPNDLSIPSVDLQSADKAFYGVESLTSLSDPRMEIIAALSETILFK
jgi:hypothetical protein